jgi:hypothetical protein
MVYKSSLSNIAVPMIAVFRTARGCTFNLRTDISWHFRVLKDKKMAAFLP